MKADPEGQPERAAPAAPADGDADTFNLVTARRRSFPAWGTRRRRYVPIREEGSLPGRWARATAEHATLVFAAFISVLPLYAMLVTALKPTEEFRSGLSALAPPQNPTLDKVAQVWTDLGFAALMKNSIILSVAAAAGTVAISALAGFALARGNLRGRRVLVVLMVSIMSVPAIVVLVPMFDLMVRIGILNMYPAAIIVEIGLLVPLGTYLSYVFMRDIPEELFQSAAVDGASPLQQLRWIALPIAKPILLTVGLIAAIFAWNDLLVPLVLWQSEDLRVLMVGLASLAPGRTGAVDVPLVMAAVTVSILPVVVLFIVTRRRFVEGLIEGALR